MVLTKPELIGSLQNEVRILLHLTTKIDAAVLDYRPTPKQRSTIELLRYLSIMGPHLVLAAKNGFNPDVWTKAAAEAEGRNFEQIVEAIRAHGNTYATMLADWTDADFRTEIEMFGNKTTRGAFLVNLVLGGCAAYRTQIFLYLKANGREGLGTSNLWGGMDAPPAA